MAVLTGVFIGGYKGGPLGRLIGVSEASVGLGGCA
jgi:hypothetical protein